MDLKIDVIKNVNNKKCAPKLIFFNGKKHSDDFWHRKLILVKFWYFWHLPLAHFSKFKNFLWVCWFLILYPPFEKSTTRIAIFYTLHTSLLEHKNICLLNLFEDYCTIFFSFKWVPMNDILHCCIYLLARCISANSFRGNYSFLNLTLYRCGNYSRVETICGNTVYISFSRK